MSAQPKTISEFSACTNPQPTDCLVGDGNSSSNTYKFTISNILSNSSANVVTGNSYSVSAYTLIVRKANTPANSSVTGHANNSMWWDNDYLYLTLANGSIRRITHSSF